MKNVTLRAGDRFKVASGFARTAWRAFVLPRPTITMQFVGLGREIDVAAQTLEDCAKLALAGGLILAYGAVKMDVIDVR